MLNEVFNEDCLVGMKRIADNSVDMILCDLPYGTTRLGFDVVIPFEPLWEQCERIIKDNGAIVLFGGQPFTTDLISSNRKLFRYDLVWEKATTTGFLNANRMPLRSHESILVFYKKLPVYNPQKTHVDGFTGIKYRQHGRNRTKMYGRHKHVVTVDDGTRFPKSIVKFSNDSYKSKHPTQKPVELLEWLVKTYTNDGDVVLDNCIGCGSTAIACINTNRNFIGFEIDETYYKTAVDWTAGTKTLLQSEGVIGG